MSPSHPFAAKISTVTGRYSVCKVIVELYAASPMGMTKSGFEAKGEMRLVPKPEGTCGGLSGGREMLVGCVGF